MVDIAGTGVTVAELTRRSLQGIAHDATSAIDVARRTTASIVERDGAPKFPGVLREATRLIHRSGHDPAPVRQELLDARNSLEDAHRGIENLRAAGIHHGLGPVDDATVDAIQTHRTHLDTIRDVAIGSSNASTHLTVARYIDTLADELQETLGRLTWQIHA